MLADNDQVLVSLVLDDVVGRKNERDVAIWTNSGDYAGTMLPMFDKAFAGSADARASGSVTSGPGGRQRRGPEAMIRHREGLPPPRRLDKWSLRAA